MFHQFTYIDLALYIPFLYQWPYFASELTFVPWRWRHQAYLNCRCILARLHDGFVSQTVLFMYSTLFMMELGEHCRYSEWLQAEWLRGQSSRPNRDKKFLFSTAFRPLVWPIQPPIQWILGVKQLGCEGDHSPPNSTKVKKTWIYTATHMYAFMTWCLIS